MRKAGYRGAVFAVALAVMGGLSIGQIRAAGFLDRWWDDLTGREAKPGAMAAPAPVAPTPNRAGPSAAPTAVQPSPAAPQSTPPPAAAAQAQFPGQAPPTIPVVQPKVQTVSDYLEITGNAAAVNQVKLIARVVGFLEQLHFEDGALVKKGDLLFTIQQDQYKAQLQQAQAQLQLQQAALLYAKTEVGRYTALLKRDAATQVDVDHWNFERQSAEANILAAQAQVTLAQLNMSYTEIRAPFDGQMGKHLIDPGNVVGGNGQEAALVEIVQLDPIYVVANISSQQALQIRANLDQRRLSLADLHRVPIEAALSDETGFPHRGTIEYVAPGDRPGDGHAARARHSCQSRPGPAARGVRQDPSSHGQGRAERAAGAGPRPAGRPGRPLSSGPEPGQRRPAALCAAWRTDRRSARHLLRSRGGTTAW